MLKRVKPERLKFNYVIDTSVLINHPEVVHSLGSDNLYVPMEVLEELDNLKTRGSEVGVSARYVNRFLDNVRKDGDLFRGVEIESGQTIFVSSISDLSVLPSGVQCNTDNRIISVAFKLAKSLKNVVVLSNDIAMRVKCDALGIEARDYIHGESSKKEDQYFGITSYEVITDDINLLHEHGEVEIPGGEFSTNEGVLLRSIDSSSLAIAVSKTRVRKLKYSGGRGFNSQGISPRSKEQVIAMELLLDPEVHLVTLAGKAGSGKTLLSVATAIENIQDGVYDKLVISRPVQSTSKDIGYLPGTLEEKMAPWLQPIYDNLDVIFSKKSSGYFDLMMRKGLIEVEALSYIRGRTLPNTIFIIDEAQNITYHEAKAVLTRMGENSKIVLIGDLEQIDSAKINRMTSGLYCIVNKFKDFHRAGHIEFIKGERSELATFAADIM